MTVNNPLQGNMAEATRLVREGRLAEATAEIQRALGGGGPASAQHRPGGPSSPAGPSTRIALPSGTDGGVGRALRPAPTPPKRSFRNVPRPRGVPQSGLLGGLPNGLTNLTNGLTSGLTSGLSTTLPGSVGGVPAPEVVPPGGRFVERSYTNAAGTRAYKLYVPSSYTGIQAVPLIVMLHGCTQDPDDFAAGTKMNVLAEEHGFLVAYPQQGGGANMQKCWNWFQAGDQRRGGGEPSIIAGITAVVVGEHHVDPDRVYVAGLSAGGAMATIAAAAYPDLFAAVGVHSGLAPGAAHDLPSAFAAMRGGGPGGTARTGAPAVPAIVFHGDRDSTVHPRNAEHLLAHHLPDNVGRRAIGVREGRAPGGLSYTLATHRDDAGRAVVEQWTVHGLGHAWSGGGSSGSYTDPKGPDASAEMARFFLEHPRC